MKIANRFRNVSPDKTVKYGKQALALSKRLGFTLGQYKSYEAIIHGMEYTSDFKEALGIIEPWLRLSDSLGNKRQQAQCYNMQGLMHNQLGDYERSIACYFKAIKIDDVANDKKALAADYGNISLVYQTMKKFDISLDYVKKAIEIDKELGDKPGYSIGIGNLCNIYDEMGDHKKALEYGLEFLKLEEEMGHQFNLAGAYSNLGSIYDQIGEHDKALDFYARSMKIAEEIGNDEIIIANLINIATLHIERKQFSQAISELQSALQKAKEGEIKPLQKEIYKLLADAYRGANDNAKAFDYLKLYSEIKDTLLNEENSKQINQMGAMYEKEKQELKISALEKEKQLSEQVIEKQNSFRKVLMTVVVLIVVLAIVLLVAFINKKRSNRLLTSRNAEIQQQKEIIEEANKSMTDSINYAKRIQEAILPAKEIKYKLFPDAFVFYQPRDIVSGDFYWFGEKDGKKIIAAVDCTGHGVPGAFMSMIGIDQLNHIIIQNGITQPAAILDHLQKNIRRALKQDADDGSGTKDGMDIAICAFQNSMLEYAGANRPLIIIKKDEEKIDPIEPDHFSIGGLQFGEEKKFTHHSIALNKGDCIYIFTDGFADQFGGPKGKKFRVKNLKELLLKISSEPMSKQESILAHTLKEWKGKVEQIDDVLVIGIRI